jgi:HPt (histidine-containing phosphotransfer) domain-containing protein
MREYGATPGLVPDNASGLLNESVIAELEDLDGEVLTSLLSLFFDSADGQVIELSGAVGRGETLAVCQTAHKLKGGSSTIGAAHVSQIAYQLEASATAGDLTVADDLLDRLRSGLDETREAFRGRVVAP